MKKLLLFVGLVIITFTECDPSITYYYEIKNDTQSELIVKFGGNEPIAISQGEEKIVYTNSMIGGVKDPLNYMASYNLTIIINDKLISDNFWQKEYWKEEKGDKLYFTYTMTLTNELLEIL